MRPAATIVDSSATGYALLCEQYTLQKKLNETFASAESAQAIACTSIERQVSLASVPSSGDTKDAPILVPPGCLTKLFTASMIEQVVSRRRLDLSTPAHTVVSGSADVERQLDGTTIKHLLEHTHGLPDPSGDLSCLQADGRIDIGKLLQQVCGFRLNRPGEIYSYSNVGAWILGHILEVWHGRAYSDLIEAQVFNPLGIRFSAAGTVCSATGGSLKVSARDLVSFLHAEMEREDFWPDDSDEDAITPLPGWNPFERGVYRGWKFYGEGWFGHSSYAEDGSTAIVRICPARRIAILVASETHHAGVVAAKVLGKLLPGFSTLQIPRIVSDGSAKQIELGPYCGIFRNGDEVLSVRATADGQLELEASGSTVAFSAAENDMFVTRAPGMGGVKCVQFLKLAGGRHEYLWDGRRVFANTKVNSDGI